MPGQVGPCGQWVPEGGPCGSLAASRFVGGWRCPVHTPAAMEGRPETAPDPGWLAAHPPRARRVREYGYVMVGPGRHLTLVR